MKLQCILAVIGLFVSSISHVSAMNCGSPMIATDQDQYISTPFYPDPHPFYLDCLWTISTSDNTKKIEITITEDSIDTSCDFLEIFDEATRLVRNKGNFSTTKKYLSSKQQLNVYYHSESTNHKNGFRARYKQYECGDTFRLDNFAAQTISSPNYPNSTDHNLDCNYIFEAERGYLVEVDIEVHTERCCDYVQVFEGNKSLGRINGDVVKSTFVSTGRTLRLLFHTDGSVNSKGFTATYKQILSRCEGVFQATNTPQMIVSPGYPNTYPNNYQCDWSISAASGKKIVLNTKDLVTESCCDYVEIFDGLTSMGRYKGQLSSPVSIVTQTASMRIRLYTDDSTAKKGFVAYFKLAENCGSVLPASNTASIISTPNYPLDYGDNLDCMWTLQSEDNTQIELNIAAGETEEHDYIQVLDDLNPVAKLSGVLSHQTYTSTGRIMRVFFHSDESATRDGFTGSYKQVCRFYYNVTSTSVTYLSSPNYPNHTPHNFDCTYYLMAPQNGRIELRILDVRTQPCCDYLTVTDGDTTLKTYRGKYFAHPQTLTSSGTRMSVFYHTDSSVGSIGFQFTYKLTPA